MSLFPAYSSNLGDDTHSNASPSVAVSAPIKCEPPKENWLENPSFTLEISEIPLPAGNTSFRQENELPDETASLQRQSSTPVMVTEIKNIRPQAPVKPVIKKRSIDEDENEKRASRKKSKRSKSHKHVHRSKSSRSESIPEVASLSEENKYFYTDKKSEKGNLNVVKLHRPATPMYRAPHYFVLGLVPYSYEYADRKQKKRNKKRVRKERYFNNCAIYEAEGDESSTCIDEPTHETTMEGKLTKQTAVFNKALGEDKYDVDMWLAYSAFQDSVCEFERTYRRGGVGGGGRRATAQRQLAIVDKALTHNLDSEALLRERCRLVSECFPGDEAATQFRVMLDKRPRSMALWQGYIGAVQFALSSCSVAKVMGLYQEAMDRFHQLRRVAAAESSHCEEHILDLLLRCSLFLRQAGLHELMWTLLKHYLELTLSLDTISVAKGFTERQVIEVEEPMLLSNLPLPEIWVRVETVREGLHWLPWDEDGDCVDPQRVVFAEDVAEMIHPITNQHLSFRLVAIVMAAFKVPALPCRDSAARWTGLSDVAWATDSAETLLTALFPLDSVGDCRVAALLSEAANFATGPTFLAVKTKSTVLGEQLYSAFVAKVMHLSADKLGERQRTALLVWWLRFERFLVVLAVKDVCKALTTKKRAKAAVKQFLKEDRNRLNLLFYREYALLERDCGNLQGGVDCLQAALSADVRGVPVSGETSLVTRADRTATFRTLAELLLSAGRVAAAGNVLAAMATGRPIDLDAALGADHVTADVFRHVASELLCELDQSEHSDGQEHLLPDFCVDWLACSAWCILLVHSVWEASAFLEEALGKLALPTARQPLTKACCRREALFECYVALMFWHCRRSPGAYSVLHELLSRALKEFPGNTALLAVAAHTENSELRPWWGLRRLLDGAGSVLAQVLLVFLAQRSPGTQARTQDSSGWLGTSSDTSSLPEACLRNRARALFASLATLPATRQCPLVRRLHLRFLFQHAGVEACRSVFYQAVEQLPWVKALYLDGAKMLPADIGQIQDLVIEKELRLHVTPEELEVLRSTDP